MTAARQLDIFDMWIQSMNESARRALEAPPALASHDGATYSRKLDRERLGSVLQSVHRQLATGKRYTLHELHAAVERDLGRTVAQTSVSAKLRDLRKVRCGSLDIRSERAGEGGTWTYWKA